MTRPKTKPGFVESSRPGTDASQRLVRCCRPCNLAIWILIALFLLILPGTLAIRDLADPNLRSPGIPRAAWSLHRTLTPKFARWAKGRLESSRATQLSTEDISGTEWPLFGSVFYLWATESLQDAWTTNHSLAAVAPTNYAREAVEAATRLVIDPNQANWVRVHWGEDYLKTQNVFYRMLVIAALTSHARLTGDRRFLPQLRDQVESLSAELDASRHGLLEDYPGECYPGDVLMAIAMIRKSDGVLGTDHSAFVARAIRGFQEEALDPLGLVPYFGEARTGRALGPSRGCGNSYVSLSSPLIWPEQAAKWYDTYVQNFWQEVWTAKGFREFPKNLPGHDWYLDVDAGPVVKGYGFAACAFGVGAARLNGHFEHACPLSTEMLAVSWELPGGTLLLPRLLSNATDAPYLGEAAILYILTRLPAEGVTVRTGGAIPTLTYLVLAVQIGAGLALLSIALLRLRRWRSERVHLRAPFPRIQSGIWLGLLFAAAAFLLWGNLLVGALALLISQLLPRFRRSEATAARLSPDSRDQRG